MQPKQNPFSIYDFLGYFLPGSLALLVILAISHIWFPEFSVFEFLSKHCELTRSESYFLFIVLAYTTGHIFSFISSLTIERYSIWRYDYPSKYLLSFKYKGYFNVEDEPIYARKILRAIFGFLILLPISYPEYVIGRVLNMRDLYAKRLDPLLEKLIWGKIRGLMYERSEVKDLNATGKPSDQDFFRFVYHFVLENAPAHQPKMQNYIALYGFLRTLTFLSVLTFWLIFASCFGEKLDVVYSVCLLTSTAFVGLILFLGFVKFYRRFSLEVLMALSVTFNSKKKVSIKKNTVRQKLSSKH
ncbi:MAG: hypothetical protein ABSC54_10270 [Smithellaceae bacterium]|jgi:hypothetical protein